MTRALIAVVLLSVITVICFNAEAECRKVTPQGGAFGIDTGTLCSFGGDSDRVLPDYRNGSPSSQGEPLFSYKEQRGMLKGQYMRNRRGTSDSQFSQAVNSAYRPLGGSIRRFPFTVRSR